MSGASASDFPVWLKDAKRQLKDLGERSALIYWVDFLVSLSIGYACAGMFLRGLEGFSLTRVVYFALGVLFIFRASSFVHEIVHFRAGDLPGFRTAWDLLCGVPLLFPSFAYYQHLDHHRCDHYGTEHDAEYLPFGSTPPTTMGFFLFLTFAWPLLVVCRFLVLTPLSFLIPRLRTPVLERFSSFGTSNFSYRRKIGPSSPLKYWAFLDLCCFFRTVIPVVLIAAGMLHWTQLPLMYLFAAAVLTLNFIRAMVLHTYENQSGEMTYLQQLEESITLPHGILAEILVPLGLRYHALHHLFPHVPYHALPEGHRRLMAALPADSEYHRSVRSGVFTVLADLWRSSWRSWRRSPQAVPAEQSASEPQRQNTAA